MSGVLGLGVSDAFGDYQLTRPGTGTPPHAIAGGAYSLTARVSVTTHDAQSGADYALTGSGPIAVADQVAVVPGAATLFIARDGATLTLSWVDTGVVLESATGVDAGAVWQAVSPAPTGMGYLIPTDGPMQVYRLRRP